MLLLQGLANQAETQQEPSQDDDADGEQLSSHSPAQQSQAAAARTRLRKLVPAKGSKRSKQTTPAGIDPPLIVEDKLIHKQLPRYAWTLMTRLKLEGATLCLLGDSRMQPSCCSTASYHFKIPCCCEDSTTSDCG